MESTLNKQHADEFRNRISALPKLKLSDNVTYYFDLTGLEQSAISDVVTGEINYYPESVLNDNTTDNMDTESFDEYIGENYMKTYSLDDYMTYNDWTLSDAKRIVRLINTRAGITIHHSKLQR